MWQGGLTVQHQRLQLPAPSGRCCKTVTASDIQFVAPFLVFYLGATGITVVLNTSVANK